MFDLHRLRLLRELHARGTLAAVAQALSYSPSAVSQQLSLLEREAGVTLLEPVGRGVRLTPQALVLVSHADAILARMELAEAEIAQSLKAVAGTLRVAAFQSIAVALMPAILTRMRERYPDLVLQVTQAEAEEALPRLVARDFELVIGEEYPGHPQEVLAGVHREDFRRDRLRLARPRTGAPAVRSLRELRDQPWILEPEGTVAGDWALAVCRGAGFEPKVPYVSSDLFTQVRFVQAGHANALLPDLLWFDVEPSVELQDLPDSVQNRRLFSLVRSGSETHPAIKAVRGTLRRVSRSQRDVVGQAPSSSGEAY
jgi:DNA-binding transcriptional LysR family regulator